MTPADDTLPIDNRCPRRRCGGDMEGSEFVDGSENRCTKCGKLAVLVEYADNFAWEVRK